MKTITALAIFLAVAPARAQVPGMFPWWESPLAKELGLSDDQDSRIRAIAREFRPRLIQMRAQVETAEGDLRDEMNVEDVDAAKASEAIDRVVGARAALTREVSLMSLQMRMTLTSAQWQELQKRQPRPEGGPPRLRREGAPRPFQGARPPAVPPPG